MALRWIFTKLVQKTKTCVVRQFVSPVRLERCRLPLGQKIKCNEFSSLSKPTKWGLVSRLAGQYYTETFAAELRRRAALRFLIVGPWGRQSTRLSGNCNLPGFSRTTYLPTFALIGFSFLTRPPYADSPGELDAIISDIKDTLKDTKNEKYAEENISIPQSWEDIEPISFLAKGCCGAVFTAKCRIPTAAGGPYEHSDEASSDNSDQITKRMPGFKDFMLDSSEESASSSSEGSEIESYYEDDFSILSETEDVVQVYPTEVHTWEFVDSDSLVDLKSNSQSEASSFECSDDDISVISESEFDENTTNAEIPFRIYGPLRTEASFNTFRVEVPTDESVEDAVTKKVDFVTENTDISSEPSETLQNEDNDSQSTEVVVKYLFNYDVESNYSQILKMFWNEALPTKLVGGQDQLHCWLTDHVKKKLPAHHNIVTMYNVFPGAIPDLEEANRHFECALPRDRYPESFGRNMTLCLVMKRYEMTLKDYLLNYNPSMKVRTMLFAQLLEGILHLSNHAVAHRDLKLNNILLEGIPSKNSLEEEVCPHLVITDFGCCLEDTTQPIPYLFEGYGKEGNIEHRAPEISDIQPGKGQFLNYAKADLWAVGVLAFEIFGISQHFNWKTREITPFPDQIPVLIQNLIRRLLVEDPSQRLNAVIAANILHVYLWGWPEKTNSKLKPFLLNLINEVIHELGEDKMSTECCLKKTFLERLHTEDLFDAVLFVYPNHLFVPDLNKILLSIFFSFFILKMKPLRSTQLLIFQKLFHITATIFLGYVSVNTLLFWLNKLKFKIFSKF